VPANLKAHWTTHCCPGPGISFLDIFESFDAEHDLGMLSIIENTCLSAASAQEDRAASREEAALDSYYESLRAR